MAVNVGTIEAVLTLRDELTARLKAAQGALASAGASIQRLGTDVRSLGSSLSMAVTAPLVAAAGGALKFSADFETAIAKVGVITDIGAENIGAMRTEILKLAPAVGIGPTELAQGLLVVASTGLKGAVALQVLEQAARASAVGLGDTKDIARATTAAMTAYGVENLSAAEATSKLFVAVRAGGAEADAFAAKLGTVVGVAQQMGINFDQVLASVATFTRLGVTADIATTGLRSTIMSLLNPSKEARDQFLAMGTSIEEVRRSIREKGFAAALQDIITLTKGNVDALGNIIPETRALASVLGTVGTQAGEYVKILGQVEGATAELDDATKVMAGTLGFQWNQAMTSAKVAAIEFGDTLAPIFKDVLANDIKPLLDKVTELARAFAALPPETRRNIVEYAALAAALGPIAFMTGNIIFAFGGLLKLLAPLASGLAALTATTVGFGVALTALAGLGMWSLMKQWKIGLDNFRGSWDSLVGVVRGVPAPLLAVGGATQMLIQSKRALYQYTAQLTPAEQALAETMKFLASEAGKARNPVKALTDEQKELLSTIGGAGLKKQMDDLVAVLRNLTPAQLANRDIVERLSEAYFDLREAGAAARSELDRVTVLQTTQWFTAFNTTLQASAFATKEAQLKLRQYQLTIGDTGALKDAIRALTLIEGSAGPATVAVEQHARAWESLKSTIGTGGFLSGVGQGLKDIWKGMSGGEGISGLFKNIGASIVSQGLGGLFQQGISLALKGIGKLFGSLFGKSEGRKQLEAANAEIDKLKQNLIETYGPMEDIDRLGKALGVDLAAAWGSQNQAGLAWMNQLSAEFAEKLAAVKDEMARLGQEAGLASPELMQFVGAMRDSAEVAEFLQLQADMVVGGFNKVAKGMTASWMAAAAALDAATDTDRSERVEELELRAKQLGAQISELSKQEQLSDRQKAQLALWQFQLREVRSEIDQLMRSEDNAALSLKNFTDVAEGGQEAFDRLGRLAVITFAAAASQGASFTEILAQMGPGLDRLVEAQDKFGFASSGTFKELLQFRQFIEDNQELAESIAGVNQMMAGLQNLGLLNQATFNDLTAIAAQTFDEIIGQGLSGDQALRLMQPTLQTIWELQQRYGFMVDENTQKLLTQAAEAGLVGEAQEDAMDRAAAAMLRVADILQDILEKIGAIPGKLDEIPKDIDINVGFNVANLDLPQYKDFGFEFGDIESAQTGGRVTEGGLVNVHGGEVIEPAEDAAAMLGELRGLRRDLKVLPLAVRDAIILTR